MKTDIYYKNLIINPENYRFDPVDNQEQAIDLMLEEKGGEIFNLAKHVVENGLDKAKDLRVLEKDKKHYLVLDGNRRTTALKCLHDTSIIKNESLKAKFDNLQIGEEKLPQYVQSFVYVSEEDAAKWIKLDHTGKNQGVGQDSWGAAEVDRFGYKFEGKISPALQAVKKVEEETGIKIDTKKLKISTVNRIFSNPEARSYLGIDIKNKKIGFASDKKEVVSRLSTLFDRIINDNINVEKVYTKEKSVDFMKNIFGDKPENFKKPELPLVLTNQNFKDFKDKENKDVPMISGTLAKSDWITDAEYKEYKGADKVKNLLREMKLLDPKNNSNMLMPALRVLLELSLYNELEEKGYIQKIIAEHKKEVSINNKERIEKERAIIELKKNWSPSFREMMTYIAKEKNGVIDDPQARKVLDRIVNDEDNRNFIADLNDFIHNVHSIPAREDPEKTWRKFGRTFFSIIKKIK